MPKNKRPAPRTSNNVRETDSESQARVLSELALELAEREEHAGQGFDPDGLETLNAAIGKALRRQRDAVLYEAIELARYTDPSACRLLRGAIEEQAASWRFTQQGGREDGIEFEIDAFLIPLFVRSQSGLHEAELFQHDQAYEALGASFAAAGLESDAARVVLVRHAYTLQEVDRIGYATLNAMLREAATNLLDKKPKPAPTIAASIQGWGPQQAHDDVLELRFLLGFSLKRADDPFYTIPPGEAESDAYFAARMARYRDWSQGVEAQLRQCLASEPERLQIDFLYQDLFYGARERAVAELDLLDVLSQARQLLAEHGHGPAKVEAVLAPLEMEEHYVLRTNLYVLGEETPFGAIDKDVDLSADLLEEVDELTDALASLGLAQLAMAAGFDTDGRAQGSRVLGETQD